MLYSTKSSTCWSHHGRQRPVGCRARLAASRGASRRRSDGGPVGGGGSPSRDRHPDAVRVLLGQLAAASGGGGDAHAPAFALHGEGNATVPGPRRSPCKAKAGA